MADVKPPPPLGVPAPTEGDLPPRFRTDWDGLDVAKSLGGGLVSGTSQVLGVPGDLAHSAADFAGANLPPMPAPASDSLLGRFVKFMRDESFKTATNPRTAGLAKLGMGDLPGSYDLPTSAQVSKLAETLAGDYKPQTDFGTMAYTVGQKLPAMPFYALTRGR